MSFTDDDLKRFKGLLKYGIPPKMWEDIADLLNLKGLSLLARLEAAEDALNSCKRYEFDDGLVIVEKPYVKLYEAWRKARGK